PRLLVPVRARLVGRVDLLEIGHPDDAAVAAERNGLDAVFRLAAAHRPQARTESDEELGDLHARPLGRDELAQLVRHDHHEEGEDDGDDRGLGREEERADRNDEDERDRDPERAPGIDLDVFERIAGSHAVLLAATTAAARSRAPRSASSTSAMSSA